MHAFEYEGLKYGVLDEEAKTCAVYGFANGLIPDIIIPAEAINEGISYKVIEIGPWSFGTGIDYEEIWTIQLPEGLKTIRSHAFRNLENVSTLIIPASVTQIESDAFGYCEGLKNVKFLDGEETLDFGEDVFYGAHFNSLYLGRNISYKQSPFIYQTDLSELTFGNNVTEIGSNFISNAKNLATITVPKQIKIIGNSAFSNSNVNELIIEDSEDSLEGGHFGFKNIETVYLGRDIVEEYGSYDGLFYENTSIKRITIGNLVNKIPNNAFYGCTGISELIIAAGSDALQIGSNSFTLVKNIEEAYLGRNISYVGTSSPFYRKSSLTKVSISECVTEISDNCFSYCTNLSSLDLPASLLSIGKQAFYECSALTYLTIPGSVTSIDSEAFYNCSGIKELNLADGEENLIISASSFSGVEMETAHLGRLITYSGFGTSLFQGKTSLKELTIGEPVTIIMSDAFRGCNNLSSIEFPSFLSSIGSRAFASCGFTDLTIPFVSSIGSEAFSNCVRMENFSAGVGFIGDFAFDDCKLLKTFILGAGNTRFGEYVFNGVTLENLHLSSNISFTDKSPFANNKLLKNVTLGEKVTKINEKAFEGCTGISEIDCRPLTPPAVFENSFSYTTYKNADLIIPEESYEAYKNDPVWYKFFIFDKPILIQSISVDPASKEAEEGESFQIVATVLPENATDKTLEWLSSDETIATVDETGLVTTLKEGECVITAKTTDGSELTANCYISIITGIDIISFDANESFDVYTLEGVKIKAGCKKADLRNLSIGIYILRNNNKVEKLVIR